MNYFDYFIRAESREQADTLLQQATLIEAYEAEYDPETGDLIAPGGFIPAERTTVHHIGIIFDGGEWDEEGNVIVEPVQLEGYHINLRIRGELSEDELQILEPILIERPSSPVAVFG